MTSRNGSPLPWPDGRLAPTLAAACRRWPDRPAITAGAVTVTYGALARGVARQAVAYRRLGIGPGDRVLCQLPNSAGHVVALNAAWAAGAIHVGVDADLTAPELAWLAAHTEAAMLVVPAADEEVAAAVAAASPRTRIFTGPGDLGGDLGGEPAWDWEPPHNAADVAHLLLTSGTTGTPKAVMETLPACWAKMQFFADAFRPVPADVHLLYLPMAHVFGMRLAMMALLSGGRLVVMERFSPRRALELIGAEGVTILPGTPAHFTLLLDAGSAGGHRLDTLRWAIAAASNLPRPLADAIYEQFGVDLLYVYGCSENFTVQTTDREEILAGSVGRWVFRSPDGAAPNGRVAVFEPEGRVELPAGAVGEIAFGSDRPIRYWKAPDAATDGWYRTGDLGRVDADGRVYVVGRLKELVNRAGLHVSPSEVETAVRRHPAVSDSAVVATPDPVVGEAICACVVAGDGKFLELADLREFLATFLARHKLPDELCLVAAIPRTKIGKVDRAALRAAVLADGWERQRWRPR